MSGINGGDLTGAFGVALISNLMNNLPVGLILWLITLRKEGFRATAWTFLKFGILVMPFALAAAVVALILCSSAR